MAKFIVHIDDEDIEVDDIQQALEEFDYGVVAIEPYVEPLMDPIVGEVPPEEN